MIPWISVFFDVNSPFAFLILLIWVFSLLILFRFARGLSLLFIFSKNQLLFTWLFVWFVFGLYFGLIFIISLFLPIWILLVLVFLGFLDVSLGP
jgi:hypothetical protein